MAIRVGRLNFTRQHLCFFFGCSLVVLFILIYPFVDGTIMPGQSFRGTLPALRPEQKDLANRLHEHITKLADEIGERNYLKIDQLHAAARYIKSTFLAEPGVKTIAQPFQFEGRDYEIIIGELAGASRDPEVVVVTAHYDTVVGSPGANDDGSGIAAILELAAALGTSHHKRTIRFVALPTHEYPFWDGDGVSSYRYAKQCRAENENVVAMISLDTIGYYSDERSSQRLLWGMDSLYPDRGNFIAFVSNNKNRDLVRRTVKSFREHEAFPCEGMAVPEIIPGVGFSDHRMFWQFGYPGMMITDTAFYRYPGYHNSNDKPNLVDYNRLARVVSGLKYVLSDLADH